MSNEVKDPAAAPQQAAEVRPGEEHRLKGNMGVAQLVFVVLAFNAPIGVVAGVLPLVIGYGGGIGAPLLIVSIGIVLAVFSVGYTVAARKLPRAGAFYTFVTAGLGRPMGLATGFVAVLTYVFGYLGTIPFAGIAGEGMVSTFSHGSIIIPWWTWALVLALIIGVLGYLRIDFSSKVLGVIVIIEVLVVLIYSAVVLGDGGSGGHLTFGSFNPSTLAGGGVIIGVLFAITAFGGFESTAIFRDEVRDPKRTIPRATYIAVAAIALIYAFSSWVLIQGYGEGKAIAAFGSAPGTAFLSSVNHYLGLVAFNLVTVLVITSTLASLTGLHNVLARYLFNLGVDGILPRALGRPHPRFGSPHRASATLTVFVIVFIIASALSPFTAEQIYATIIGLAGYALMVLLLLASVGIAVYLLRTRPSDASIWHRAIAPVISVVVMLVLTIATSQNINSLTGSAQLSVFAIAAPIVAIVLGVIVALAVRAKNPDKYQNIGTRE